MDVTLARQLARQIYKEMLDNVVAMSDDDWGNLGSLCGAESIPDAHTRVEVIRILKGWAR